MALVIKNGTWDLLIQAIRLGGLVLPELAVADLGCMTVYPDVFGHHFGANRLWEQFGARYVSFDIAGCYDALSFDLGQPLPEEYCEQFDIVGNFGCAEHVETSQHECWKNAHNLCRPGGMMVHAVPEEGSWRGHCKIRYTVPWITRLCEACGYEPMLIDRWDKPANQCLVRAIFRKGNQPFPTLKAFETMER